jgi:hypothetical protein
MATNDRGTKNVIIYNEAGVTLGDATTPLKIDPTGTTAQPVTAPTITKATQGANGWTTQDLKDSGRVIKTYVASGVTGVTSEGLITLTPYADLAAGGTGTSFGVTSGKRLRLQTMICTWRNGTAAAGGVQVRFRTNASGAAIVSSPVQLALIASTTAATSGQGWTSQICFPDGFELSGTMQFALTQIAVGAVAGFDVSIMGYEY